MLDHPYQRVEGAFVRPLALSICFVLTLSLSGIAASPPVPDWSVVPSVERLSDSAYFRGDPFDVFPEYPFRLPVQITPPAPEALYRYLYLDFPAAIRPGLPSLPAGFSAEKLTRDDGGVRLRIYPTVPGPMGNTAMPGAGLRLRIVCNVSSLVFNAPETSSSIQVSIFGPQGTVLQTLKTQTVPTKIVGANVFYNHLEIPLNADAEDSDGQPSNFALEWNGLDPDDDKPIRVSFRGLAKSSVQLTPKEDGKWSVVWKTQKPVVGERISVLDIGPFLDKGMDPIVLDQKAYPYTVTNITIPEKMSGTFTFSQLMASITFADSTAKFTISKGDTLVKQLDFNPKLNLGALAQLSGCVSNVTSATVGVIEPKMGASLGHTITWGGLLSQPQGFLKPPREGASAAERCDQPVSVSVDFVAKSGALWTAAPSPAEGGPASLNFLFKKDLVTDGPPNAKVKLKFTSYPGVGDTITCQFPSNEAAPGCESLKARVCDASEDANDLNTLDVSEDGTLPSFDKVCFELPRQQQANVTPLHGIERHGDSIPTFVSTPIPAGTLGRSVTVSGAYLSPVRSVTIPAAFGAASVITPTIEGMGSEATMTFLIPRNSKVGVGQTFTVTYAKSDGSTGTTTGKLTIQPAPR